MGSNYIPRKADFRRHQKVQEITLTVESAGTLSTSNIHKEQQQTAAVGTVAIDNREILCLELPL